MKFVHAYQHLFDQKLRDDPELWPMFVMLCLADKQTAARFYIASKRVVETLRNVYGKGINNHLTPLFARHAETTLPEDFAGWFELNPIQDFNRPYVEDHDPRATLIYPFGRSIIEARAERKLYGKVPS